MSSLSTLEAPSAILAATEGIGLAALGLGKEAHIDLLYKSQVSRILRNVRSILRSLLGCVVELRCRERGRGILCGHTGGRIGCGSR